MRGTVEPSNRGERAAGAWLGGPNTFPAEQKRRDEPSRKCQHSRQLRASLDDEHRLFTVSVLHGNTPDPRQLVGVAFRNRARRWAERVVGVYDTANRETSCTTF